MKVTIERQPAYAPRKIVIVLESEEEEVGFTHLIGCSGSIPSCDHSKEREMVSHKIYEQMKDFKPGDGPMHKCRH